MSTKTPPTGEDIRRIRANIHPPAHSAIVDWNTFPWHGDRYGVPDTHLSHSSQAFCISIWGTLARADAENARAAVAELLTDRQVTDALEVPPKLRLEFTDPDVLKENAAGIPTNIDALLMYPGLVLVVESKLTERFGSCSQVSRGYCTGRYESGSDLRTSTTSFCRLEIRDGRRTRRRYWEVMRSLSDPDAYRPGQVCPFARPGYQIMRNIAFASEFAALNATDWRVIFAFPKSLSKESSLDVQKVVARLRRENRKRVLQLDYEQLAVSLAQSYDPVALGLSDYMSNQVVGFTSRAGLSDLTEPPPHDSPEYRSRRTRTREQSVAGVMTRPETMLTEFDLALYLPLDLFDRAPERLAAGILVRSSETVQGASI